MGNKIIIIIISWSSYMNVSQMFCNILVTYLLYNHLIGLVGRVFGNGPRDLGSIPGCIIPKTLKMVLDASLLNTQKYKVGVKSKVEQSSERSSALPYTLP